MRTTPVEDPRVAWSPSSLPTSALIQRLDERLLAALERERRLLREPVPPEGSEIADDEIPELAEAVDRVRDERLDHGFGFTIWRGLEPSRFSPTEIENIFWRVCNRLGVPFVQKDRSIRFGRVENLGKSASEHPRYHETGTGGSVHTDSPIMPRVADYVGLLCVRRAREGGESKFVSIAQVHNRLLQHAPDLLEALYEPYFFDRRIAPQAVSASNPAVLRAPILTYDSAAQERGIALRWQPEYVWEAPRLPGVPALSARRQLALHLLEGLLEDRAGDITVYAMMQPGDMQLLNNHRVAHGRTAFVDPRSRENPAQSDPTTRRLMRRVWVHSRCRAASGRPSRR